MGGTWVVVSKMFPFGEPRENRELSALSPTSPQQDPPHGLAARAAMAPRASSTTYPGHGPIIAYPGHLHIATTAGATEVVIS